MPRDAGPVPGRSAWKWSRTGETRRVLLDALIFSGYKAWLTESMHLSAVQESFRELADKAGIRGFLVDGPADLRPEWLSGIDAVGVTAGASAPELLVQQVVEQLREWGGRPAVEVVGREENVVFALPKELRRSA